jgi:hypothetical protein
MPWANTSMTNVAWPIDEFVKHYNQHPDQYMWAATAASILAKIERVCRVINGIRHWTASE